MRLKIEEIPGGLVMRRPTPAEQRRWERLTDPGFPSGVVHVTEARTGTAAPRQSVTLSPHDAREMKETKR